LTLTFTSNNLTNRPPSRFKFWTSISANPNPYPSTSSPAHTSPSSLSTKRYKNYEEAQANGYRGTRESWLEEQTRKKRKRALMCWGFWGVVGLVVAGVVVAVVLLRGKGII
jgi:hypothetical protein